MILPSLPQILLLLLLGGAFIHFTMAGARTFHSQNLVFERGATIGQCMFMFGGAMPAWFLGLHQVIGFLNGMIAAVLATVSLGLYEWARHSIAGRRFGLGWGEHVPDAVCTAGPYRWVRHPIYLSYVLAYLAVLIALPHWLSGLALAVAAASFMHAALHDERRIAASALATDYGAYRERTGMFLPKVRLPGAGR